MTPKKFASLFREEKDDLLKLFMEQKDATHVGVLIASLELSPEKTKVLHDILDGVLTDAFYTILLGLDGCASIGSEQNEYSLTDESGNEITPNLGLDSEAWQMFHSEN